LESLLRPTLGWIARRLLVADAWRSQQAVGHPCPYIALSPSGNLLSVSQTRSPGKGLLRDRRSKVLRTTHSRRAPCSRPPMVMRSALLSSLLPSFLLPGEGRSTVHRHCQDGERGRAVEGEREANRREVCLDEAQIAPSRPEISRSPRARMARGCPGNR
jgi:hypothetical protein